MLSKVSPKHYSYHYVVSEQQTFEAQPIKLYIFMMIGNSGFLPLYDLPVFNTGPNGKMNKTFLAHGLKG
jgi:hypothetical protein